MIVLTDSAVEAVKTAISKASDLPAGLRIQVEAGGCAGYKYMMGLVKEPGADDTNPVSLSYHMNRLQRLQTQRQYFVTLNRRTPVREDAVIDRAVLTHPIYTAESLNSQPGLRALNGRRRTWYAGAYLGYGFHEDAVRSAVDVASHFGAAL